MKLVYITEDDENIREIEEYALAGNGYEVVSFGLATELWENLEKRIPDILILDIMLPDGDGVDIVRSLRANHLYSKIPVILVTAKTREIDIVRGLDNGADDYISKPFSVLEFTSRVNSLLRRSSQNNLIYTAGILKMNTEKHAVTVKDSLITLTNKEYELLKYLFSRKGTVFTRTQILENVWGYEYEGESRTLDMHIKTLRQKLGEAGRYIVTIRNVGFVLREE